jgi:predicted amidohydrolase
MKICAVQYRPVKGDIKSNIENHVKLIELSISNGAETIIFPELSITGYEPELARELATDPNDDRFDVFQKISDEKEVIIGIGLPTRNDVGICISMILFQPQTKRQTYSKNYLHSDEEDFFVSGQNVGCLINKSKMALAICYELSVPEHSENAFNSGAELYIASVAKSASGIEKAFLTLSDIARKYSMSVILSNSVGHCDNFDSAGKSFIWNNKGLLIGQLDDRNEGIIIFDSDSEAVFEFKV